MAVIKAGTADVAFVQESFKEVESASHAGWMPNAPVLIGKQLSVFQIMTLARYLQPNPIGQ